MIKYYYDTLTANTGYDNLIFLCSQEPLDDDNNKIFNINRPYLIVLTEPWSVEHVILPDPGTITSPTNIPVATSSGNAEAGAKSLDFSQLTNYYGAFEMPAMWMIYKGKRYHNLLAGGLWYEYLSNENHKAYSIYEKYGAAGRFVPYITIDQNKCVHFRNSIPTGETVLAQIEWGGGGSYPEAIQYLGGALPISEINSNQSPKSIAFNTIGPEDRETIVRAYTSTSVTDGTPPTIERRQLNMYPLVLTRRNPVDDSLYLSSLRIEKPIIPYFSKTKPVESYFLSPDLTPFGFTGAMTSKIDKLEDTVKKGTSLYISR